MKQSTFPRCTAATQVRLRIAKTVVESIPPKLAPEIAITGSCSRGVATRKSDVELNAFSRNLPIDIAERPNWLAKHVQWLSSLKGATDINVDKTPIADGSIWVSFRFGGVWFEMSWQHPKTQTQLLERILAGEIVDHARLILADVLVHAKSLRSEGDLSHWQSALSTYPPGVRRTLLLDALDGWMYLPHIQSLWTLEEPLKFYEGLVDDCCRTLRILFASNGIWEPDWKRLPYRISYVRNKPVHFMARYRQLWTAESPLEARWACTSLSIDVLRILHEFEFAQAAAQVLKRAVPKRYSRLINF